MANVVSMKLLLEAGVHFGHQTRRWDPRMRPYIFTERNGIHIIDLQQTVIKLNDAYSYARDLAAEGKTILFIGTKKQAQEAIENEAKRCEMFYVNQRWMGGMLTNFRTIQSRIRRLQELETAPSLFNFVLLRLVKAFLRDVPGVDAAPRRADRTLEPRAAVRVLLATVAAFGSERAADARAAYAAGIASVGWGTDRQDPTFEPPAAERNLERLDAALAALAAIRPREKQRVLRGVLAAIRADAVTATEERELFRVIAVALDCPVPPDVAAAVAK